VIDAFNYGTGRDLTGYEDGTENPQGKKAVDAAIVSERGKGLDGSSFVAAQLWMHDFKAFDAMSSAEQDNAIGRRKSDNQNCETRPRHHTSSARPRRASIPKRSFCGGQCPGPKACAAV
jgi:putative iron-dependent peroxidase